MSSVHDIQSRIVSDKILLEARQAKGPLSSLVHKKCWKATVLAWPREDAVIIDKNNIRVGFEYKPPREPSREYIGGLGQALSYLQRDHYSFLIVPQSWAQLDFLLDHLNDNIYQQTPIGLISVDIEGSQLKSLQLLRAPPKRTAGPEGTIPRARRSFVFWRDLSPHEILILLHLSSRLMFLNPTGSIEKKLWNSFFDDYFWPSTGPSICKDFKGVLRTPGCKGGNRNKYRLSQKINYITPLKHIGLIDADCRLTELGVRLLSIGLNNDPVNFKDFLAARVLREGGFLELIFNIRDFQGSRKVPRKASSFYKKLYRQLEKDGKVFSGRTGRYTTGAKPRFRDEAKLMNKLDLLEKKSSNQYFFPTRGFKFRFERIISILDEFP